MEDEQLRFLPQKIQGILFFCCGLTIYTLGNALFKYTLQLNGQWAISSLELNYWVAIPMLLMFYLNSSFSNAHLLDVKPRYRPYLIYRFVVGALNDLAIYLSFSYTSFSKSTCI